MSEIPENFPSGEPLHHRAELPGREFVLAEAELLALALLARSGVEHELEDALAHVLDGGAAVGDRAAVDVHVVAHALEERRVGGELQAGRGLAAEDRAAA